MCGGNLPPHPNTAGGIRTGDAGAGSVGTLDGPMEPGGLASRPALRKNPVNWRLWFNDYPYGILAAETYMVLAALDLMGSHQAAEDGFDQWVSLPMEPMEPQGDGHTRTSIMGGRCRTGPYGLSPMAMGA